MRKRLKELDAQANRLLAALAEGTVGDTALFRAKLSTIESERELCIQLLSRIDTEIPPLRQVRSNRQAADLAQRLKKALLEAPKPIQRRYVHGLVSEIRVDAEKIVISGSRAAIAAAVTAGQLTGAVPTFVRDWRTGQDSNQWSLRLIWSCAHRKSHAVQRSLPSKANSLLLRTNSLIAKIPFPVIFRREFLRKCLNQLVDLCRFHAAGRSKSQNSLYFPC